MRLETHIMATTAFREDHLGRDLQAPTVNALDPMGRVTTSTVDYMGRPLRRVLRANTTAVTLGQELQFTGNQKFVVTVAGTTAASPPAAPAVGATVADGTATLLRQK
jgi:hypothetical protein